MQTNPNWRQTNPNKDQTNPNKSKTNPNKSKFNQARFNDFNGLQVANAIFAISRDRRRYLRKYIVQNTDNQNQASILVRLLAIISRPFVAKRHARTCSGHPRRRTANAVEG
jgi:hypothetical protein